MKPVVQLTETVCDTRRGERGVALLIALFVVLILFVLGSSYLTLSVTESKIARNEINSIKALGLADAGVDHARKTIFGVDTSAILDGTAGFGAPGTPPFGPNVDLADGTYEVVISNNNAANGFPRGTIQADPSGSATVDDDSILVITSTGSYQGGTRIAEAIVRRPQFATQASVSQLDGPDVTGAVEIEDFAPDDGARIDGRDCNPPSLGGGPGPGPDVMGIGTQTALSRDDDLADLDTDAWGVTGINGAGDVNIFSDPVDPADFLEWVAEVSAMATPIGSAPCILPVLGTWASPQICASTGSSGLDGLTGAGILIVNDNDGSDMDAITYEGIIIVLGDGRFRLTGSSRIYGAVFLMNVEGNHSGETRLRVRDDSQICYSSLAIENNPGWKALMAWYEEYTN